MSILKKLAYAGATALLAGVAAAQVTLFDTGPYQACVFNGVLTNLGWTSGDLGGTSTQRWAAQPFSLPAGNWQISQIAPAYFVPAANPANMGWRIWNRTGSAAPTVADEVASGTTPFTAASAPFDVNLVLPGGDYYLSIYAVDPVGVSVGWFTNAQNGIHLIEPSNALPFMWRAASYPAPGFAVYQLPATTLSQQAGLDPNKLYCADFRILGFPVLDTCTSGVGGALPDTAGGTWPTALPTGTPFSSAITLPAGTTSIDKVKLNGLSHTWVGDSHIVLVDPNGAAHNLIHRIGFAGTGFGNSGDFLGGDYEIVESGGLTFPTSGNPAAGTYNQEFGAGAGLWPSGNAGVFNTPLSAIPVIPGGVYTLVAYDWAGGDTGNLVSWELCGSQSTAPSSYCVSGTSLNGCVPVMGFSGVPSLTASSGFTVTMSNADVGRNGGLLYGLSTAQIPLPGTSSFLCTTLPRQRLVVPMGFTGGTVGCDGSITTDLMAFLASHPAALGAPFTAGETIYVQGYNRDNGAPPRNLVFSNGLAVTFLP